MPPLLLELWREQHPEGHEQTTLNFAAHISLAQPVPLFEEELDDGVTCIGGAMLPSII